MVSPEENDVVQDVVPEMRPPGQLDGDGGKLGRCMANWMAGGGVVGVGFPPLDTPHARRRKTKLQRFVAPLSDLGLARFLVSHVGARGLSLFWPCAF